MSGYGKATPRAWRRGPRVRAASAVDAIDIEAEAKAWAARAVRFGFCLGCGAVVDEAAGKLHDDGCITADPSRCGKRSA